MSDLEKYFAQFRSNIIGIDAQIETPFGIKKLIYADWIASGRLYQPIEERISYDIGPLIGNTHSESSATGYAMTKAYQLAQKIVKRHVHANDEDVLIFTGSGMTSAISKLQRILGLKIPEQAKNYCSFANGEHYKCKKFANDNRPVVFITHMEHHSNHTSWLETIADVVIIPPGKNVDIDLKELKKQLDIYKNRSFKIGTFTACSNVTGVHTPYHQMARLMHEYGG